MAGVGKIGIVILALVCSPAAARLSGHSGKGQAFRLPGWLINVSRHQSGPRGTQRKNRRHPTQPLNAVVEQESRGDFHSKVVCPQAVIVQPVEIPALILSSISIAQAIPVSDPAFRCTFLI